MRLFQAICALVVLTAAVDSRANAEGDAASIETDGSAIVINAASVSIRATAGAKAVAVATSVDIDGLISRIQALEDQRAEDITAIATLKRQMVAKEAEIVQIAATCSLAVTAENVTTAIEGAMASVVTAENVTAAIDGAIHRDAKALTWSAHGKDNTEESLPKASIYLGRYNANEVLTIDVGDSGCGSGTAMQYQLVGGYGTHPRVLSLGGHGAKYPKLDERIDFFASGNKDKGSGIVDGHAFNIWGQIRGHGPCGGKFGNDVPKHHAIFTMQTARGLFKPTQPDGSEPKLDKAKAKQLQQTNFLDFHPPTTVEECEFGTNGDATGCASWQPVAADEIVDVLVMNTHASVVVDVDSKRPSILGTPTDRGCGKSPGSSMGVFIRGAWTKMRYRLTIYGRSSCWSALGHERYNGHDSSSADDHTPTKESVDAGRLFLGEAGLFPFSEDAGDSISNPYRFGKQFGENEFADAAMTCNPGSHLWNQQVVDTSRCRDEGGDIDCLASQFEGKGGKAYVGKRQATIEQRRRYHTFSGAQRQYVEDAGMSIGVSCATLGDLPGDDTDTRWTFDQIEILV